MQPKVQVEQVDPQASVHEVQAEAVEVEAHEEDVEVQVEVGNGLNRDNIEGAGLVDVDLNVASDIEVEGINKNNDIDDQTEAIMKIDNVI